MDGISYDPEFLFTCPNVLTGVMDREQATLTLGQVARVTTEQYEQSIDEAGLQPKKDQLATQFDRQPVAFYAACPLLDQGVFYPHDTRHVLGNPLKFV